MAIPNRALVHILEETADRVESGGKYMWGHHGHCNCGQLAQTVTRLRPELIHRSALKRPGEWSEQVNHYCPASGLVIDNVFDALVEVGLSRKDIGHLEYLSDRAILERLPGGFRWLERNQRDHLVLYLRTWAGLLTDNLPVEEAVPVEVPELAPA